MFKVLAGAPDATMADRGQGRWNAQARGRRNADMVPICKAKRRSSHPAYVPHDTGDTNAWNRMSTPSIHSGGAAWDHVMGHQQLVEEAAPGMPMPAWRAHELHAQQLGHGTERIRVLAPKADEKDAKASFTFVHDGHCAAGWINANTMQPTIEGCSTKCFGEDSCGYFAYNAGSRECALFTSGGGCPDDDSWPDHNSYRIHRQARKLVPLAFQNIQAVPPTLPPKAAPRQMLQGSDKMLPPRPDADDDAAANAAPSSSSSSVPPLVRPGLGAHMRQDDVAWAAATGLSSKFLTGTSSSAATAKADPSGSHGDPVLEEKGAVEGRATTRMQRREHLWLVALGPVAMGLVLLGWARPPCARRSREGGGGAGGGFSEEAGVAPRAPPAEEGESQRHVAGRGRHSYRELGVRLME